jgi:hypothetical protein
MRKVRALRALASLNIPGREEGLLPLSGQGDRLRSSHVETKVCERGTCTRRDCCLYSAGAEQVLTAPLVGSQTIDGEVVAGGSHGAAGGEVPVAVVRRAHSRGRWSSVNQPAETT